MVALTLIHINSVSSSAGGRWPPPRRSQSHPAMKNSHARPAWAKFPCSPERWGWNNLSFSFSCRQPRRFSSIYFPVNIREVKGALKPSAISCWIKVCRFNLFSQIKYTFFYCFKLMLTRVPPAWEFECCATVFLQWLRKDKQTNFSLPWCVLFDVSILVFGRFPGKSLTF